MDLELNGHAAVITGGASGIGLACARGLAREGCHVALWDLSSAVVDVASAIASDFGVRSIGIVVDVRDFGAVE